jgi:hypothetical protein
MADSKHGILNLNLVQPLWDFINSVITPLLSVLLHSGWYMARVHVCIPNAHNGRINQNNGVKNITHKQNNENKE